MDFEAHLFLLMVIAETLLSLAIGVIIREF